MYMISIDTSIVVSSTATIADYWWYGLFYFACMTFAHAIFRIHLTRLIDQSLWHRPQLIRTAYHNIGQFTALSRHSYLGGYVIFVSRMNVSENGISKTKILIRNSTISFDVINVSCVSIYLTFTLAKIMMAQWLWRHCALTFYYISDCRSHISKTLGTHAMYFDFHVVTADTILTSLSFDQAPVCLCKWEEENKNTLIELFSLWKLKFKFFYY